MQISEILWDIERGSLALPMFQRGYVWTRKQVKEMMESLYRGFPIGTLLIWKIKAEDTVIRGEGGRQVPVSGSISVLLDGQQRATSLYGLMKGEAPRFFDGDAGAFTDLYFHLEDEVFQFRSGKMATVPLWASVTDLFQEGGPVAKVMELQTGNAYTGEQIQRYLERALKIHNIWRVPIPTATVPEGIDSDTAIEIFNKVNQAGKKLSQGDLVLTRIAGNWPEVREEMKHRLEKWDKVGFTANRDWLLRCLTALAFYSARFDQLATGDKNMPIAKIQEALERAEPAIDRLLEATRTYLGMDTDKVHKSKQAFPAMVKFLVNNGGDFPSDEAKAQLLYWYISASIWGRYTGTTETNIDQDLRAVGLEKPSENPIEALLQNLIQAQGNRTVEPESFDFNRTTARFYPLLHIMSRVGGARDWGTGKVLPDHEPGPDTALELHHIFPKSYLGEHGFSTNDANNFGNLAFQTRDTNRGIGNRPPSDYMPEVVAHQPGALESQWVPTAPALWKVEKYREFLAERRRLLAEAANAFMESLRAGNLPAAASGTVSGELDENEEEAILARLNNFVVAHGLPAGELGYGLLDAKGDLVELDLAWPKGLQDGLSEPVAVLIDEADAVRSVANDAGFRLIFTTEEAFIRYVQREILGEEDEAETEAA